MTASCFSTPLPVARPRLRPRQLLLPAVVALVLAVAVMAPERPDAQAEICQRHNGVAACRVW